MSWHDRTIPVASTAAANALPVHTAQTLTNGGNLAHIMLEGQTYTLRITRQGKLILTK